MSNVIDQRVVEMRFDNRHFEKNTATTMSTLDKLKQKLNFGGVSKSLEKIDTRSVTSNMTGLGKAVETVSTRFSALQVMGVTALANITNSAVNAGKRIVSALTIDPIKTGFQEYETQINAVQTILANTESKGTTIDDVNKALEELNRYADKTIYNFTEMTRNIGTFTAAGVDLDTSVNAIQGIANLAAVSGSTSQQASTAMYQLSQALASGTVKLMDWNSVVNAGMGGEVFQNALKETARIHGVAIDSMIESEGSFRETLKDGWLTSEILTETLSKFTMTTEGLNEAEIEANREKLRSIGYTEEQIEGIFKLGRTATDAATKVKTFTQLWDVMKEAAQSGWAQTWKIIIGDFEEAKALLTPLSDFFTGVINRMSEARNKLLDSALNRKLTRIFDSVNTILGSTKKGVESLVEPLQDLDAMVDKIMLGELGNGEVRWNALTEAGYNWCEVQNKVNEAMGDGFRYTEEQIAEQNKLLGVTKNSTEATDEQAESEFKLTDAHKRQLKVLAKLSDEQLRSRGYTEDQIAAVDDLRQTAEMLGMPIEEFIDNLDQINGRFILIQGFKNIGKGLIDVFNEIGAAWKEVFNPGSEGEDLLEKRSQKIFDLITAFAEFTSKLRLTGEDAENLRKTFEGLFAIIDIIYTITSGGLKVAFELLQAVLGYFDLDILKFTALIGDGLVKFRDFIDAALDFSGAVETIMPYFEKAAESVRKWIEGFKETDNIPKYIVDGLVNGLKNGASAVWEGAVSLAKSLYDAFCEFFKIESPSKLMIAAGGFIILGLIVGLTQGFDKLGETGITVANGLFDAIKGVVLNMFDWVKNIDFGSILSVAAIGGVLFVFNKIANALTAAIDIVDGVGDIFEGLGEMFEGIGKNFKAAAWEKKSKALLNMAIAIGILVAAIIILTKMCTKENIGSLLGAVAILGAIAGILVGLSVAIDKLTKVGGFKVVAIGGTLLAIGLAMLLLAGVAKIIAGMTWEEMGKAGAGLVVFTGVLATIVLAMTKLPIVGEKQKSAIKGVGSAILAVGVAMLLMAGVAKIIAGMTWEEMGKAGAGIGAFALIIVGLLAATRLAGGGKKIAKVGSVIFSVGAAMLMMAIVAKIIAGMTWEEMGKAGAGIGALSLIIVGLIAATKLAGNKIKSAGGMIAAVGAAMLLLVITAKIIAGMEWTEMGKAAAGLVGLGLIITGLIWATRLAGPSELKRVGTTLLLMSVSIGILGLTAALLGSLKLEKLAQGVIAVSLLGLVMAAMVAATRGATDVKGNLIVMTAAIAVMAIAVAALSFIDPEKLKAPVIAMGILMGMFAVMTAASKLATGSMGNLIVMTVAMGLMAGLLYLLKDLPVESTIGNAIALGALMLAMSGSLALASIAGKAAGSALLGVLALTAMAIPLLAFVGVLALMQNIQNATTNATLLASLAATLTILLIPLTLVGALIAPALLGVLALTTMAVPLLAFVGVLALMENLQNAEKNLNALMKLMTAMTAILVVLAIVGPMATVGVGALAALELLMVGLGALAVGIGALVDQFPALETFLDKGVGLLEKLAYGLGSVVGSFITGFSEEVMTILPKLGASLSAFMVNAMPFIVGAKMVDERMMAGVKALAETILILTAVDVINGLTSWLTGGSSLASFGEQLPQLGKDLSSFASNLDTFDEAKVTTITCAANAIKALAEAAESLPNEGGWAAKICGDNSISAFGSQLPTLGIHLAAFANNLDTFDESKVTAVDCAARAIKAIATAASELPNEGGWAAAICGDNSISTFGGQLATLGSDLSAFATNLDPFDESKVTTVTCAANAIKAIADVAQTLPNDGGWWGAICGDNDIGTFSGYLPDLGTNLSDFANNLGTFDEAKVATVDAAMRAVRAFATLANSDLSGVKKNIEGFGNKLGDFGTDIGEFCTDMSSVEGIDAAIANMKKILTSVQEISAADTAPMSTFAESLKKVGKAGVEDFVGEFTSSAAKTNVKNAAKNWMEHAIQGVKSKKIDLQKAVTDLVSYAGSQLKTKTNYQKFYSAGSYLVDGFAAGISENAYKAEAKARAMASAAATAAEEELDINSPSKVFRAIGYSIPEGLAAGIDKLAYLVTGSSSNMANMAVDGVKESISRITHIFDSEMDIQPAIRPVLDLSDVRSGASTIGTMLGMNRSVGVLANVGAISTTMNRNRQNGANDDVVSAINKLRDDIGGIGDTNYNINGISYSDGDVTEAIKTIVRAARVERRT